MLSTLWTLSVHLRNALHQFAPTNILSGSILTRRRGLKWGVPAMLLAAPYFAAAYACTVVIDQGAPCWSLYLVVVFCAWNALKMIWLGPVSLIHLARVGHSETRQRTRP